MPLNLRIILIAVSIITLIFVFRKIRKSQFVIEDTLFWLFFCMFLIVLGVFPKLTFAVASLLGFAAASNFVFVAIIFLLLVKLFLMSLKISKIEGTLHNLIQKYALDSHEDKN